MDSDVVRHDSTSAEVTATSDQISAGARRRIRAILAANKPLLVLAVLGLALLVANIVWLLVNRRGGAMDIDEAGYLRMSITDYEALRHSGVGGLASTVLSQPTQAPLVPLLSSLVYFVVGRPMFVGAFVVQLLAYLIVIVTTCAIGSRLANRWAGLAAALAVASLPIMVDYTHEYSFAVPAAAAAVVAVWAAIRSDRMMLKRFTVVWGLAIGAMLITRTVTIAFLPSFVVMAVLHAAVSPHRKRSLIGILCGLGAASAVAGPWYWAQAHSVWQYLTSFGYGAASVQYGRSRSLLSPTAWLATAHDYADRYLGLFLAVVLVAGGVALVAEFVVALVRRRVPSFRTVISSPWFYLALVVAEGLLALQSSRNTGSAYPTPILPVMLVLAIGALARIRLKRRSYQYVALGAVVALCMPSLIAKTAFNTPNGQPITVEVPGLASLVVVDARSEYLAYASSLQELNLRDTRGVEWRRANDELLSALDAVGGAPAAMPVVFAFDHSLVNPNTLGWEELMFHGTSPAIYLLTPPGKGPTGYSAQLGQMLGSGHGVVLVCADRRGMFPPILDQATVRAAAAESGFRLEHSLPLPDGAAIEIWVR